MTSFSCCIRTQQWQHQLKAISLTSPSPAFPIPYSVRIWRRWRVVNMAPRPHHWAPAHIKHYQKSACVKLTICQITTYVIIKSWISHEIGIFVEAMLSLAINKTWTEERFETWWFESISLAGIVKSVGLGVKYKVSLGRSNSRYYLTILTVQRH